MIERQVYMNVILLSGGSGKRLWPLSNEIRSKQFIKLLKKDDGIYESMVQRVYRFLEEEYRDANIVLATSKDQVATIKSQLNNNIKLSVEPERRDTYPAIALASAFMKDFKYLSDDDIVIVAPVDSNVDVKYFKMLQMLESIIKKNNYNVLLVGIEPTSPASKYGYIIPKSKSDISKVETFKEKLDKDLATEYIKRGGLWNSGIFVFKIGYILNQVEKEIGVSSYDGIYSHYSELPKISFDYHLLEKEFNIGVVKYSGSWNDLGTWNSISDILEDNIIGEAIIDKCEDVHIINETDCPIIALGLHNMVIAASSDGILISEKNESTNLKNYVDKIHRGITFAEKSWGCFKVVNISANSLTIRVSMKKNDHMNYHSHKFRNEVWVVVSGIGKTIVDGFEQIISEGDVITIQSGCKHTIKAITDLELIEVQLGKQISNSDKIIYPMEWYD